MTLRELMKQGADYMDLGYGDLEIGIEVYRDSRKHPRGEEELTGVGESIDVQIGIVTTFSRKFIYLSGEQA